MAVVQLKDGEPMRKSEVFSDMPLAQLERYARDLEIRVLQLEQSVDQRFSELVVLTELLEQGGNADRAPQSVPGVARPGGGGIFRVLRALLVFESLKTRLLQYKQVKVLKHSPLFDAQWYLDQYPDLANSRSARRHPERHYVRFGAAEGRNPGPEFNSQRYLDENPDVAELGVNPLWHYIEFGQWEGRMAVPVSR